MENKTLAEGKVSPPPKNTWSHWFMYFQYDEENEKPSDARNFLLVIAALIAAAVTFQAGVNPPGGVWQDNDDGHHAGRAIYASQPHAYYVFLISNTLALSTSILIIVSLTYRFPLHFEIWVATISMIVTYGSAVFAVTPRGVNPPGGVWQDDKDHHAGRAIYASQKHAFYVFLVFNTLALSTSIHVILYLSYKFPLHFEIWVATASVIVTYGSAIFAVTPHESVKFRYVLLTATLPLAVRFTIQTFKRLKREAHEPVSGVEQEE
ncbi:hypothetical protein GH714_000096 [Hevea brasiliensis]|uniref:PGG domain-containing protein n=1 Tax=Hevea brasiliensis TaxID=3981 RepID=A0A6A6KX18_HEVBR|nr:hypothetical protein GH714_000096 [Hevea brasiliensis]